MEVVVENQEDKIFLTQLVDNNEKSNSTILLGDSTLTNESKTSNFDLPVIEEDTQEKK